jgi:hypothetical protein
MLKVGLPAILYRFLGFEWLLDHVLTAMVTRPDDPIVRETIAASLRYVEIEREFPSASADEFDGFTAPVALFLAEMTRFSRLKQSSLAPVPGSPTSRRRRYWTGRSIFFHQRLNRR